MVGSLARDAHLCSSTLRRHFGAMLRRYCLACLVLPCATAPGICCGARIQFHVARGQLRLRPTTIRVVPSCTSVASLLVRHDRLRGIGQASASLHAFLCTPPVSPCAHLQSALAHSQVVWFVLTMGCRLGRRARLFRAIIGARTSVILQSLCCQYMHICYGTFR